MSTFRYVIEEGKAREFRTAVQHATLAAGSEPNAVPPLFLSTAHGHWATGHDPIAVVGFDPARVLHGEEEVEFPNGIPTIGMELQVTTSPGRSWTREGSRGGSMRFGEVVAEFVGADGELVARQTTVLIEVAGSVRAEGDNQ